MQVRETDSILNEHPKSMTHLRGLKILVRRTTRADKRADGSFTVDLNSLKTYLFQSISEEWVWHEKWHECATTTKNSLSLDFFCENE